MSLAQQKFTAQEYLKLERELFVKNEFYNGKIYAMAGANERHNLIVSNLVGELRSHFKGRPCRVMPSDMRVKVSATGLYTYPDVLAWCGEAQYEDEKRDTLLNPTVVFEVLSASTENYDRGEKFAHYRRLLSVTEYILVSQDRFRVEHFCREADGRWMMAEINGLQGMLNLKSVGCELPLSEIYDKVDVEPTHPLKLEP